MTVNYHSLGYAKHVLYALAVHGGRSPIAALGAVNQVYAETLTEHHLIVADGDSYTLTESGWEVFRDGTGYRADVYGPGLVKGQPVTS